MMNKQNIPDYLEKVKNISKKASNSYRIVNYLQDMDAPEELINTMIEIHNMIHVPLNCSGDFDKENDFVCGWVPKK